MKEILKLWLKGFVFTLAVSLIAVLATMIIVYNASILVRFLEYFMGALVVIFVPYCVGYMIQDIEISED